MNCDGLGEGTACDKGDAIIVVDIVVIGKGCSTVVGGVIDGDVLGGSLRKCGGKGVVCRTANSFGFGDGSGCKTDGGDAVTFKGTDVYCGTVDACKSTAALVGGDAFRD